MFEVVSPVKKYTGWERNVGIGLVSEGSNIRNSLAQDEGMDILEITSQFGSTDTRRTTYICTLIGVCHLQIRNVPSDMVPKRSKISADRPAQAET
jgi:hypothetical protein